MQTTYKTNGIPSNKTKLSIPLSHPFLPDSSSQEELFKLFCYFFSYFTFLSLMLPFPDFPILGIICWIPTMADEDWVHTRISSLTHSPFSRHFFCEINVQCLHCYIVNTFTTKPNSILWHFFFVFLLSLCCFVCFLPFVLYILSLIQTQTFWANHRPPLNYHHT